MAFVGILVSNTYMAEACEVDIEVACVFAHVCKNGGSICSFSIMAVLLIFAK